MKPPGSDESVEGDLPREVRDALIHGGIDGLLLDVQGAGMMMVDGADGEHAGEATTASAGVEPERFAALRSTLGVDATDVPVQRTSVPPPATPVGPAPVEEPPTFPSRSSEAEPVPHPSSTVPVALLAAGAIGLLAVALVAAALAGWVIAG